MGGTRVVGVGLSSGSGSEAASQVPLGGGMSSGPWPCGQLKKAAITCALKAALQRLAIIRFPASGKVVVRTLVPSDDESAAAEGTPTSLKRPRGDAGPSTDRTSPQTGAREEAVRAMPPPPPRAAARVPLAAAGSMKMAYRPPGRELADAEAIDVD